MVGAAWGSLSSAALRGLIRTYQLLVSPLLPPSCRYWPSCSHYATEAITTHGAWQGSLLAARRLLRCHPWGGSGYDPVPPAMRSHAGRSCPARHRQALFRSETPPGLMNR